MIYHLTVYGLYLMQGAFPYEKSDISHLAGCAACTEKHDPYQYNGTWDSFVVESFQNGRPTPLLFNCPNCLVLWDQALTQQRSSNDSADS